MPIWKRERVVRAALRHVHRLRTALLEEGVCLEAVIVGSEGQASAQLVKDKGRGLFHYVECPNSPLGGKFQAGVSAAQELSVDAVVINGSDDFLSLSTFKNYVLKHYFGATLVGVKDATLLDRSSGRAVYWPGYTKKRVGEPAGTGRFYSARILNLLEWELYPRSLERGLDAECLKKMGARQFTLMTQPDAYVVALKTADAINGFPGGGVKATQGARGVLNCLFPETQEDILQLLGGPHAGG